MRAFLRGYQGPCAGAALVAIDCWHGQAHAKWFHAVDPLRHRPRRLIVLKPPLCCWPPPCPSSWLTRPYFTAVKATSNKVQASLSPFQVQLESPLPTATTLVSAGSAPDPQTLPSSSKKRERERIHLSELDIAAYPGYVTYFRQDGAPIGTYRLDTRWDNSSDFANHGTNDHSASCSLHGSNSSSDQEEEIERETTPVSRALCKILFCGVDEAIPPYVSPPRVRPSSKQLRNYVQQDRLVGRTRKRQYVGASGIKSVNRQNRVVKTTAASRRLARLPNPSKSVFQIFEDDDSTPAPATDSLLMEACSYPSATPADRYANKENSGFLGF